MEKTKKTFGQIWSELTSEQAEYLKGYINRQRQDAVKEYKAEQLKLCGVGVTLCGCKEPIVINWVACKDEPPPKHTKVLLYNTDNENYAIEFIHEFDLTTNRYKINWTHWAEFKPPCL